MLSIFPIPLVTAPLDGSSLLRSDRPAQDTSLALLHLQTRRLLYAAFSLQNVFVALPHIAPKDSCWLQITNK